MDGTPWPGVRIASFLLPSFPRFEIIAAFESAQSSRLGPNTGCPGLLSLLSPAWSQLPVTGRVTLQPEAYALLNIVCIDL